MITDRPGVISTMSAAARAASVAPETAMPQSAFFNAGASFTPSARHADDVAALLQDVYNVELMFGNTWAKPSAFLDGLGHRRRLLMLYVARPPASRILAPSPNFPRRFPERWPMHRP